MTDNKSQKTKTLLKKIYDPKKRIIEVANDEGVNASYALATAFQESSFKVDAFPKDKNGKPLSSAYGLFQFTDAAWKDYKIKPGSKKTRDPEVQISLGIKRIKQAQAQLRDSVGREPTNGELYMSHVFGPTGGSVLASANPKESLLSALGRAHKNPKSAAKALSRNPWIRKAGISNVGQLKSYMERKTAANVQKVEKYIQDYSVGNLKTPETSSKDFSQREEISPSGETEDEDLGSLAEKVQKPKKPDIENISYEVTDERDPSPERSGYRAPGITSIEDFKKGPKAQPRIEVPKDDSKNKPKFQDIVPPKPLTLEQEAEYKKQLEEDTPGYFEAMKIVAKNDFSVSWALDGHDDYKPDPSWKLTEDWLKENAQDVPIDKWEDISYAWSEAHATGLLDRIRQNIEYEKKLSSLGVGGMALRFGVNIFDPATAPLILATGGLGLTAKVGKIGSRLGRAAAFGGVAAVEGAAVESLLVSQKPLGEVQDIAYAAFGSLALGATIGSFTKGVEIGDDLDRMVDLAKEAQKDSLKYIGDASNLSAAKFNEYSPINLSAEKLLDSTSSAPFTAMPNLRWESTAGLKSSPNSIFRDLGNVLGQDTVGNADGSKISTQAATEYQTLLSRRMETKFATQIRGEFDKWAKENNVPFHQLHKKREEFMNRVTDYGRDTFKLVEEDLRVKNAANKVKKLYEEYLVRAQNPGAEDGFIVPAVKGFDQVKDNPHYVPRINDQASLGRILDKFPEKSVAKFIGQAIRGRFPGMSTEDATKLGTAYLKQSKENTVPDPSMTRALSGDDLDGLRKMLVDDGGLDDEIFGRLHKMFTAKDDDAGKHSRAKGRQLMDEKFSAKVTNIHGGREELSIADFFVRDAEQLFKIYNRQMSGAVALARAGYSSKSELESVIRKGAQTAHQVPGYTSDKLKSDTNKAEFLGTMILGSPVGEYGKQMFARRNSQSGRVMKVIRDYNFIRIMNQVGMVQLGEIGNILGIVGFKTALSNMPGLKSFMREAKNGTLRDDLQRELEAVFGIGTDRLRNNSIFRQDDFGDFVDPASGKFEKQLNDGLEIGKKITADISLMTPINNFLQRWAVRAVSQRFTDAMDNPNKLWSKRRLAQAGLDLDDVAEISEQIKKHAKTEDGVLTKHKLKQLNTDKWDPKVRHKFKTAVYRVSTQVIQENDPGNMHEWMSIPLAQMMAQFRTFMIVSHGKQLLNGIHARDINTVQAFLMSMVTATMAYALQKSVQSVGRPDAEEYRKKYLSTEAIAKNGVSRAGFMSFVPAAADNLSVFLGEDPIFDARASGLSSAGLGQNPSTQFAQDAFKSASAIVSAAISSDKNFTEKDANRLTQTFMPFYNANIINQGLRQLNSGLPEK